MFALHDILYLEQGTMSCAEDVINIGCEHSSLIVVHYVELDAPPFTMASSATLVASAPIPKTTSVVFVNMTVGRTTKNRTVAEAISIFVKYLFTRSS